MGTTPGGGFPKPKPKPDKDDDGGGGGGEFCDPVLGRENPETGVFCDQVSCWRDVGTNISGTLEDPAVYVSLAFGGWASGLFETSFWGAATACIGNPVCRAVTGMAGGAGAVSQTDYYVTANGQAIPSTGYRYSAGSGFNNAMANGSLPARSEGTYFTFQYYVEKAVAKSSLQMPYLPEKAVSFNTLQIIDDIHVPNGMYGASSILEPLAVDFPQFGAGGATQVITYSPIQINAWWWLK